MDPVTAALALLVLAAYLALYRRSRADQRAKWPAWQVCLFSAGVLIAASALQPPLDSLADDWFWAHMTQHMLLLSVAPPLLMLGLPAKALLRAAPSSLRRQVIRPLARARTLHRIGAFLVHPLTVFTIFNGVLLGWHVPAIFAAAEDLPPLHYLEHTSYFAAGCLLWWVIVEPLRAWPKDGELSKIVFVALCHLPMLLLGQLLLAFTSVVLYHPEVAPAAGALSPLSDQRLGGAIMFGLDMLITFATVSVLFGRFLAALEARQREQELRASTLP